MKQTPGAPRAHVKSTRETPRESVAIENWNNTGSASVLLERDWKVDLPWPTVKPLVRHGYEVKR